jgi:hypothetical protein
MQALKKAKEESHEAQKASLDIDMFEWQHGLKEERKPENKYPTLKLKAHYELDKKLWGKKG